MACNIGASYANAPFILFLNNDTELKDGWLEPLVKIIEKDTKVGCCGAKMLFPDGKIQHAGIIILEDRKLPDPLVARHLYYNKPSRLSEANEPRIYQALTGACLLIRKELFFEIGGFDTEYWNGYEDIDLCFKIQEKKLLCVYEPKSVIVHHESKSGEERFRKVKDNIERLHKKWIGRVTPDAVLNEDGSIKWINQKYEKKYNSENLNEKNREHAILDINDLVTIVVITYNQISYTKKCIESIEKNTEHPYEIIFVDNGSNDSTVKWIEDKSKNKKNYRIIRNNKNLGFAKGCNQGIKAANGEYIVLLNNDTIVTNRWLPNMLKCLKAEKKIGIVGPMTNNISGCQKLPSVDYSNAEELEIFSQKFYKQNCFRIILCNRIVGFCMLFRKTLTEEIGLFDEEFGSGNFEDDDFCLRATLAGYQNMIAGDVFIHHFGSRTFIGNRIDYSASISGNRKVFDAKWGSKEVVQQYGKKLIIQNALNLAEESSRKGDIEQATAHMLTAIKEAPQVGKLYLKLAEILIDSKRYEEAKEILESIPQTENAAKQHALMSYCQEALGSDEKALEHVEQALAIDPQMALALNVRGVLAYKRGELEAAERCFNSAIEADPSFGESYTNLGSMRWAAGEHEAAFDLFERGFILAPTAGDVASAYHTAVAETQSFSRAETVLAEACALHPNDRRIAFIRIAVLIQQEKNEEAMDAIEHAMLVFGIDDGMLSAAQEVRSRIGPISIRTADTRKKLSVCMIVKNEEAHLARCLQSIKPVADELIVVDTGSTDRTKAIASAMGAHVYDFQWTNDFSEARNFSLSKASGGWILVLDADEVISPLDHLRLKKIIKSAGKKRQAYTMVTRNYTDQAGARDWSPNEGSYIREEAGKGWIPSPKVRLFPNDRRVHFVNPVHELVEPSLKNTGIPVKDCDVPVHHFGRLNQEKLMAKGEAYYQLGVEKIEINKGDYNALRELAIQAAEIGRYAEAVDIWQRAFALKPEDASAYMNLGYAHLMLNQYDKVAEYSQKALELDPDLREAALNHAAAELIAGDAKRAISMLEGILTKHPNYPPAMGRLVAAHVISGQKEAGLAYLDQLVRLGFDCAVMIEEQARAIHSQGKAEQAALLLETAIANGIANERMHAQVAEWRRRLTGLEAVQGMTNTINQTAAQRSVHRNIKTTPQPSI
jgi:GT2 family glycosyltransferase/lipoprotein NlpI